MKLLSIGFLSRKLLYPFFMGMNYFALELFTLISRNWAVIGSGGKENYFNHHPFFMTWLMFLSKIPYIFVYFIQSKLSRDDYTSQGLINIKDKGKNKSYINNTKFSKIKLMLLVLVICIFDIISSIIQSALREINITFFNLAIKAFLVIFTLLFGVSFLNAKYSRHHFAGIIFILIGIIIYSSGESFKFTKESFEKKIIIFFACMFGCQILIAGQECCEKFCMEYIYISPYLLISIEGICGTIMTSLLFIPLYYLKCDQLYEICDTGSSAKIEDVLSTIGYISRHHEIFIILIIVFICYMFFNAFRVLTNHNFSPSHRVIADIFGSFLEYIAVLIFSLCGKFNQHLDITLKGLYIAISMIAYVIIVFGVCVVLELIIVHCLGIDIDTERYITTRASEDLTDCMIKKLEEIEYINDLNESTD